MTKTITYLLLMLITILVGTYFYITCCSSCGTTTTAEVKDPMKEKVVAPVTPQVTSYPFAFSDGDYAYNENDNYNFNVSSSSISMPLSQKVTDGVGSLKTFLAENATKVVNLTGYYKSDETNSSAFPNLGLARANTVKNNLVENGISSTQINTTGKLMDGMIPKDNMFLGPIEYGIGEATNSDDELQALYDKINANPLVFYFETNQAAINLSATQRQKLADISKYLDKVEGASCSVIGHTDSVGPSGPNLRLGQGRANFAKEYLVKNGISSGKINAASKGESQPVASNANASGQAKNRRTVVTLNK